MTSIRWNAVMALVVAILAHDGAAWAAEGGKKRVAILICSSEARYFRAKDGIKEAIKEDGFESRVDLSVHEIGSDKEKVAAAVAKLAAENLDAYMPLGTVCSLAAAKTVHEKPVVFAHVYDPVSAGLIKDWTNSGNNLTGASNNVALAKFIVKLNTVVPLKKIAVLYTPGEKQSELHLADYQKGAKLLNIEVNAIAIKGPEDIASFKARLGGKPDALFITGGLPIGKGIADIIKTSIDMKIITATHVDAFIEAGVLLGLSANDFEVGKIAGKALVQVLKGAAPASVPISFPVPQMIFNAKTAKAQGFVPSADLKQWISKTLE